MGRLVWEATLQSYTGVPELHCSSTDREERFGKAKFGDGWIGRQSDSDLLLLARVRDRSGDWQSFGSEDGRERRSPDYVGPPGNQDVSDALNRALQRKRKLAQVRELLTFLDRFANSTNPALSEISDDELAKLTEARQIASIVERSLDPRHDLPSAGDHARWLAKTLAYLSACQRVREAIGWEEIADLIDPVWLRGRGVGPSTSVDIGALKGKLISEPPPRTSGPPTSAATTEPVISYDEAFDRVGHARFGDVWRRALTDEEQRELEAGLWQASSAEAYRLADEKAKAIERRYDWVDKWLADNGLMDPVRRQHGLEIPPISRKRFEAAYFPVFGESHDLRGALERAYEGTIRGALERALADQTSQATALASLASAWAPPALLSLDQVKAVLGDEPRPFLSIVVDVLAFGEALPGKVLQFLDLLFIQKDREARTATVQALAAEGYPVKRIVSERRRAAAALFDGAKRAEQSVFVGSQDCHSDQSIPPHYFDVPRNLGFENNSISADLAVLVDDRRWQKQFDAERENRPSPWLNVRVDRKWLVGWLTKQLTRDPGIPGLVQIPTEAGNFILQAIAPSGARHTAPRSENIGGLSDTIVVSAKKRGKASTTRDKVKEAMRADLANGLTPAAFYAMAEKQWDQYPAGRTTCRQARNEILAECAERAARDGDEDTLAVLSKIAASNDKLFELSAALAEIERLKSRQTATIDK